MNKRIDIVKQWIEKADHDLGTAQVTYLYLPEYSDTIAFHCQQAVEKYLKGYLFFLDIPFKKFHSLNYLLSILSKKVEISTELFDRVSELEDFAIEIRYPDNIISLSDEDLKQSFEIVKFFRNFVLDKMNLSINYKDVKNK